jgi:acylphosphatase
MPDRVHLEIHGLVQGVGFRYATLREARRLGLSGFVRNRRDGAVEVVAEGPETATSALAAFAHRGPAGARVDRVVAHPAHATGEFQGFRIEGTV